MYSAPPVAGQDARHWDAAGKDVYYVQQSQWKTLINIMIKKNVIFIKVIIVHIVDVAILVTIVIILTFLIIINMNIIIIILMIAIPIIIVIISISIMAPIIGDMFCPFPIIIVISFITNSFYINPHNHQYHDLDFNCYFH